MLGLVFVLGVRIAAPVIVVLLLVELALGLLARVAPSLNVMVAGAPVRLIVGLLVVAASVTALPALITRYVPTALRSGRRHGADVQVAPMADQSSGRTHRTTHPEEGQGSARARPGRAQPRSVRRRSRWPARPS